MEADNKHLWVDEMVEALREEEVEITPELGRWITDYYDEQSDEWKRRQPEERETYGLMRRLKKQFGPPPP